jgi:hypothetical protein
MCIDNVLNGGFTPVPKDLQQPKFSCRGQSPCPWFFQFIPWHLRLTHLGVSIKLVMIAVSHERVEGFCVFVVGSTFFLLMY